MTPANDDLKAIHAAKTALARIHDTDQGLRAKHEARVKERFGVTHALRSEAELVASIPELVGAQRRQFEDRYVGTLVTSLSGHTELRPQSTGRASDVRERRVPPRLPDTPPGPNGHSGLTFQDLCGLVPDLVVARLTALVTGSGKRFGLPAEARAARLAALDAEIATIEAQHGELVDAAAAVGITLALLPAVQERRQEDAERAAREREIAAERAKGLYPVGA